MGQTPATRKHNAQRKAKAKTDGAKYLSLVVKGYSYSAIASRYGVSKATVHNRIQAEYDSPAPDLEQQRARENAKYDSWERELHALKAKKKDDPEVVVSVHARLARIAELRTRLNGIAVPVKTDPDLVVSTAATTAAATVAAVEARPAAPAIQIVLATEVEAEDVSGS